MSSKFWSFFIGMFLFMTYGLTHLHHTPALLNLSCTAFADDDDEDFDSDDEIEDELDTVTEEEDFLDDAEEAEEEQVDDVIDEMMQDDEEDGENAEEDETLEIPTGSENTPEAEEAKVDNELR